MHKQIRFSFYNKYLRMYSWAIQKSKFFHLNQFFFLHFVFLFSNLLLLLLRVCVIFSFRLWFHRRIIIIFTCFVQPLKMADNLFISFYRSFVRFFVLLIWTNFIYDKTSAICWLPYQLFNFRIFSQEWNWKID